jgi:DNA-binding MurR/RpiR family transcriptional regulator
VEGAQQARARGAYCVGIADTFLSPLARECNELFVASIESTSFAASYAAPIALLNAVLVTCAQYRRTQTLVIVKELAEEQRKGFRWYPA